MLFYITPSFYMHVVIMFKISENQVFQLFLTFANIQVSFRILCRHNKLCVPVIGWANKKKMILMVSFDEYKKNYC